MGPAPVVVPQHLGWTNTAGSQTPASKWFPEKAALLPSHADDPQCPASLKDVSVEWRLGHRYLYGPAGAEVLFTDNETNGPRVFGDGAQSRSPYVKDAFHRYLIHGELDAVNPEQKGTKACLAYKLRIPAGGQVILPLRFTTEQLADPLADVGAIVAERKRDADEFYAAVQPPRATPEELMIQRQAFAGLLWSKQIYLLDVATWMDGDDPPPRLHRGRIPAISTGGISIRCAFCRCRTSGNTRGLPLGTSRFGA